MGALWALLHAAIERLNQQQRRIAELEAAVRSLDQQLRAARGN